VCGQTNYVYQYITQKFPGTIGFDPNLISISTIDIEVQSDEGFPEPAQALHPITAICLYNNHEKRYRVWGLGEYVNTRDDVYYKQFSSELLLLLDFLEHWQNNTPDVLTGWNSRLFDVPYMVNRINRLMGNGDTVKRLSPWGVVHERNKTMDGRKIQEYEIMGVEQLDGYDLFKKFPYLYGELESYKLDHVAMLFLVKRNNPTRNTAIYTPSTERITRNS
jgi:DNA polymerase elongation subunit (family B)